MATLLVAAVLAGAATAAIALAPAVSADRGDTPGPSPRDTTAKADNPGNKFTPAQRGNPGNQLSSDFSANLPTGWTNEALWARPGAAGNGPFGSGPRPPVVGLD